MILAIIIGFLLIFICWILFAPIFLYVNTQERKFSAGLKGILRLKMIPDETEILFFQLSIFFYPINYYPFKKKEKKKKVKSKEKKPKKKWKVMSFRTLWLILKVSWKVKNSFRIKKLYLNVDSNDVINNAYLIPIFVNINRNNINLNVNYKEDFEMIINIENNIFRILVVSIHTYLRHKKIL